MNWNFVAEVMGLLLLVVLHINTKQQSKLLWALFGVICVCLGLSVFQRHFLWHDGFLIAFIVISLWMLVTKKESSIFLRILLIISLVFATAASYLFPIRDYPKSTGEHEVGTTTFTFTDLNRLEEYGTQDQMRSIKLQAWYPITSSKGLHVAPWLYDGKPVAQALATDSSLPSFLLEHMASISSHSYMGGELVPSSNPYPVILLSHGWRSARNLYQDLAEDLASHGYIVFAIDHTYGAVATYLDEIGWRNIDYSALSQGDQPDFMKTANKLVNTYAQDVGAAFAYIKDLNDTDARFANHLDLSRVGLLGHSTGGGGDVRFALNHPSIKSLIGLDAWVEPIHTETIEKGLNVPSLFLRSQQWQDGSNNGNLQLLNQYSEVKPMFYQVEDTTHYDFAMTYMYTPVVKTLGFSGKIDEKEMVSLLRQSIVSFFDQTVKEDKVNDIQIPNNHHLKAFSFEAVDSFEDNRNEIDAYKQEIEQAYKQQLDYVQSLKDETAKQSVQTPYSAAVSKETELEMQNEKDVTLIQEAFREFLKENQLSE